MKTENIDNAGWATFATALGLLTAPHWLAQFAISIFTLGVGIVLAHFLKRELHRRWPYAQRARRSRRKKEAAVRKEAET